MSLELSMVGLVVRSMPVSLEFYRRLGVEIPADADRERVRDAPHGERCHLVLGHSLCKEIRSRPRRACRRIPDHARVLSGQQEAVDAKYQELVGFGYHGRSAPVQTSGPYAAMVDDPDGNMILLTAG